ncbi:MFS transporter [Gordonia sp. NPDC003376]
MTDSVSSIRGASAVSSDTETTPPAASPPTGEAHPHRWWILVVLATAQLMVVLDATIVNIALPAAQQDLGFDDDLRQWVVTAYSLAFGGLLLLGGRINDQYGRKQAFIIGLVGFAAASALGGWSPTFEVLVIARALQGVFGALLAPAALSLLTVTFSHSGERGRAFGIYGAISGAGGAIGLLLGGVLTEYISWNWCLYVNVIFAMVALIGAVTLIPAHKADDSAGSLDWPGTVTATLGLFSLVYGLANSEVNGWSDAWTITFIVVGVTLLAVFVLVETKVTHPLLPLRVVLDRVRGTSYLVMFVAAIGMFGVFLFLTYYLQATLGYSPVATGVAFLPMVAALALTAAVVGNVTQKVSPKILVGVGLALSASAMVFLTTIDVDSTYAIGVLPGLLLFGIGLGSVFATAMGFATSGVAAEDAGVASATVNTAQQVGGSMGISLLSSFAATAAADYVTGHQPTTTATPDALHAIEQGAQLAGYHTAFWWSAGFFAVGAVLAALLYPTKPPKVDAETVVIAH